MKRPASVTFKMRIKPELKEALEKFAAKDGYSLAELLRRGAMSLMVSRSIGVGTPKKFATKSERER